MDENEYMLGVGANSKVVFSKNQKQAFIKQARNQGRVSLEAIGKTERQLPFLLF